MPAIKTSFGAVAKMLTAESVANVFARIAQLKLLGREAAEDVSLGCGAACLVHVLATIHLTSLVDYTDVLFGGALALLRSVCPSPLPAEWWVSTCAEVDVTSVRLVSLTMLFG